MMGAVLESDFRQKLQGAGFGDGTGFAADQQRHGDIFGRRKLGQQMMALPDEANGPIAEVGQRGSTSSVTLVVP